MSIVWPGKDTNRKWVYAMIAVVTTLAGAATRFAPLGLPTFVVKYGGSALWAAGIYWMVSFAVPRLHRRATLAMCIAAAIEFLKLLHTPMLEALRPTLFGKLVLGRYFAWADLLAYAVGIAAMWLLDKYLPRRVSHARSLSGK